MENINIEEMEITIVDSKIQRTAGSMVTMGSKGRMSLSDEARTKLDVVVEDYLIFGKVGDYNLVAKRPHGKNLHGFTVKKPSKSSVHYVGSVNLVHIPRGKYNFGDVILKDDFAWFPLVKQD